MSRRAYEGLLWVMGAIVLAACLLVLYWLLFPAEKVTVGQGPWKTDKSQYRPGDRVLVAGPETCNIGTGLQLVRHVADDFSSIQLNPIEYYIPPQAPVCINPTTLFVTIPSDLPDGQYRIVFDATYRANPIRQVTITHSTNEFRVDDGMK